MDNEKRGVAANRGAGTDQEVEELGGQVLAPEDQIDQEELFDPESEDSLARQAALLTGSFGDDEPEDS